MSRRTICQARWAAKAASPSAKTKPALDFLSGQFQSKTVEAVYQVLTVGAPAADAGTLEFVLKEDEAAPGRMCVVKKHGHAAVTDFKVLGRFGRFGWLECRPRSARRHQIRVHLATAGTPVTERLWTRAASAASAPPAAPPVAIRTTLAPAGGEMSRSDTGTAP